jgi:hypothetical protein
LPKAKDITFNSNKLILNEVNENFALYKTEMDKLIINTESAELEKAILQSESTGKIATLSTRSLKNIYDSFIRKEYDNSEKLADDIRKFWNCILDRAEQYGEPYKISEMVEILARRFENIYKTFGILKFKVTVEQQNFSVYLLMIWMSVLSQNKEMTIKLRQVIDKSFHPGPFDKSQLTIEVLRVMYILMQK